MTLSEIEQQPATWLTTQTRIASDPVAAAINQASGSIVISGAGTSAYAAGAVGAAWKGDARAIPTTDLVTDLPDRFPPALTMLSLARSGNSPESLAAVQRVRRHHPHVAQFAITCNAEGDMAKHPDLRSIILDPRTNDRGLAMTSSFSNLVLAGILIQNAQPLAGLLPKICATVNDRLRDLSQHAHEMAESLPQRMVVLASPPLFHCAREAALKVLELTAGRISVLPETFLGLRHGPMSFVDGNTLVLAFVSSDAGTRRYERDVLAELRAKKIGRLLGILPADCDEIPVDESIPAVAEMLPDCLRTPFEIVYAQLLAYHLSRQAGLDPDNPSPAGVIFRVVQGVTIYAG